MPNTSPISTDTNSHIVLVGPMGAGKSSIGRLLAARYQRAFVDLDAWIEAEAGTTINSIFTNEGERAFRLRESSALTAALARIEPSVIATGGGAVLDAGNRRTMSAAGAVVYLQVQPAMQMQRLAGDGSRPLLATSDPLQRLAELQALREPLYREVADMVFDTTHFPPPDAVVALMTLLAQTPESWA